MNLVIRSFVSGYYSGPILRVVRQDMSTSDNVKDNDKMPFKFSLSIPISRSQSSSLSSSPASSPISSPYPYNILNLPDSRHEHVLDNWVPPGNQPKDVYDSSLPWWRAAIRRRLLLNVRWESGIIARMQVSLTIFAFAKSYNLQPLSELTEKKNHIGKHTHPLARRLFCLYFLFRHTHILYDRPSRCVFLRSS